MTQPKIAEVVIIYNPNSTGNGAQNAKNLRDELKQKSYKEKVRLLPTKYPKHAEKIAATYSKKHQTTLLVSSSGDGGYHELINGILKSGAKNIISGLLPSGNANDHFSAIGTKSVADEIITQTARKIDVLRLDATVKGQPWTRYAHSYIGIGISPVIGRELNKTKLNPVNEKIILMRQLVSFRNVRIIIKGKKTRLTSLVFANIPTMSKVLKLAKKGSVDDGKFEVSAIKAGTKFQILSRLFQASTFGLKEEVSTSEYHFKTIHSTPIQLDGEIYTLDSHSNVTVSVVREGLRIII